MTVCLPRAHPPSATRRARPFAARVPALLLATAVAVGGCASVDLGDRTLAGTWTPIEATQGGAPMPMADLGKTLRLTADRYAFGDDRGSYWVVSAGPPARINLRGEDGPHAGRIIPAIYRLTADRLLIGYQFGDGPAPAAFESPPGSQVVLVRYRRMP